MLSKANPISLECLNDDTLHKLGSGECTPIELSRCEEHVSQCHNCRELLETRSLDDCWKHELLPAFHNSMAAVSTERENHDSVLQAALKLLGPTDDPHMLGRIGSYEVVGLIGCGGMGMVFKAFDGALNRFVAIKMLLPHLAASGAARKRFAREGQAVAAVVDDHVMAIHGVDEWQGVPYLVMTYSRGVSLQKRLSDNGPLEVREILRIGMQAARGLAAAHAQGIVHRDIKPANIFLDQNVERVQLMDFGLARAVDDASLTRSGTLAGTPQYMSPEQARAETVDHRSDLFSLGSVLYAMCTGHAPFRAESSYSVLRLITDKEPRPIREINPEIPEWLCAIISKLMSKQPCERFDSAEQVAELLGRWLAHLQQPESVPAPKPLTSARKYFPPVLTKWIWACTGFFALVAATVIITVELEKGTLTISSPSADVPIRITRGDKVVDRITVKQGENTTCIAAGQYVIEIDGNPGDFTIDDNTVNLTARGKETVVITQIEPAEAVPATRIIEGKSAPVVRQQASERTKSDADSDVSQRSGTVQVVYGGPKGLVVSMWKGQEADSMDLPLENHGPCPSRWDLATPNQYRRLQLTGIPGHDEVIIEPIFMLEPANSDTESFLAHNAIPIEFTIKDFEQIFQGNHVRKIIYLPDPEFANSAIATVETLVSTDLDPEVNMSQEAQRLGSILAIVEIEDYVKRRTETCEGMPLSEAVRNLNASLSRRTHQYPEQPPLTVDEVVAWARWNLSLMKDNRYERSRAPYQRIVDHGVMHDAGCFTGDVGRYTENDVWVSTFHIQLNYVVSLGAVEGDFQHYVRRKFVESERKPGSKPLSTEGRALSDAIAEFNESCMKADPSQLPLTEEEVIAALRNLLFKNWIDRPVNMTKDLVATINTITDGHVLPASAEFVLNTEFEPGDGVKYKIWRPSIRIAADNGSEPRTFPLRTQFISAR